jgi:hypothetical protein
MDRKHELPIERHTLKTVATKFNIYFLFVMALLCAVLFFAGIIGVSRSGVELDDFVPDELVLLGIGAVGFALFFPWFTALYVVHHLLVSMEDLEARAERLSEARKGW